MAAGLGTWKDPTRVGDADLWVNATSHRIYRKWDTDNEPVLSDTDGVIIGEAGDAPTAHTLASHSTKAHSELTGVTSDLHHAQVHNAASHSDIASTGANIDDAVSKKHAEAHDLDSHGTCTLAELNADISDATLIDTADARLSDDRDPNAHVLSGPKHTAPTTLMQYIPIVLKASVAFDDASPKALITVQDGDIIKNVWAEVTTIWDGNGTVTLGDGDTAAGFATDANLVKGDIGYRLYNAADRGVYLWNVPGTFPRQHIYTGADTIDAVIVTGTSTQGAMDVYFEILRLK